MSPCRALHRSLEPGGGFNGGLAALRRHVAAASSFDWHSQFIVHFL